MIPLLTFGKRSPIEFGNFTDVGTVRSENEDYYGFFETELGSLFIVCDGMGGHVGGKRASRLAVETIAKVVTESVDRNAPKVLKRALASANRAIRQEIDQNSELEGMGTTCVLLLVSTTKKPTAWRVHIGDSRLYRIRLDHIEQLTQDHSMVSEMQRRGLITEKEAEDHPQKNVITRALGVREEIEPEIETVDVCKGDRFILCTDGISGPIPAIDMEQQSIDQTPQVLAERLVKLANERSGDDNATVQIVDCHIGPKPRKPLLRSDGADRQTRQIDVPPVKHLPRVALYGGTVIILLAAVVAALLLLNTVPGKFLRSFFSQPTHDLTVEEIDPRQSIDQAFPKDTMFHPPLIAVSVTIVDSGRSSLISESEPGRESVSEE